MRAGKGCGQNLLPKGEVSMECGRIRGVQDVEESRQKLLHHRSGSECRAVHGWSEFQKLEANGRLRHNVLIWNVAQSCLKMRLHLTFQRFPIGILTKLSGELWVFTNSDRHHHSF